MKKNNKKMLKILTIAGTVLGVMAVTSQVQANPHDRAPQKVITEQQKDEIMRLQQIFSDQQQKVLSLRSPENSPEYKACLSNYINLLKKISYANTEIYKSYLIDPTLTALNQAYAGSDYSKISRLVDLIMKLNQDANFGSGRFNRHNIISFFKVLNYFFQTKLEKSEKDHRYDNNTHRFVNIYKDFADKSNNEDLQTYVAKIIDQFHQQEVANQAEIDRLKQALVDQKQKLLSGTEADYLNFLATYNQLQNLSLAKNPSPDDKTYRYFMNPIGSAISEAADHKHNDYDRVKRLINLALRLIKDIKVDYHAQDENPKNNEWLKKYISENVVSTINMFFKYEFRQIIRTKQYDDRAIALAQIYQEFGAQSDNENIKNYAAKIVKVFTDQLRQALVDQKQKLLSGNEADYNEFLSMYNNLLILFENVPRSEMLVRNSCEYFLTPIGGSITSAYEEHDYDKIRTLIKLALKFSREIKYNDSYLLGFVKEDVFGTLNAFFKYEFRQIIRTEQYDDHGWENLAQIYQEFAEDVDQHDDCHFIIKQANTIINGVKENVEKHQQKAEEARKANEARKAEQARRAEEARKAAEAKQKALYDELNLWWQQIGRIANVLNNDEDMQNLEKLQDVYTKLVTIQSKINRNQERFRTVSRTFQDLQGRIDKLKSLLQNNINILS